MNTAAQPLVDAMSDPGFYPHRASRVEVRQTHISWVFLAGDYAYKLKKPVRFEFLDYSTRERRRFFCCEEVRLNRRLAPAVYLGVLPVLRTDRGFELHDGATSAAAQAEDYVVKMRRLPDERMLDRLLRDGSAGEAELSTIAEKLAPFHDACSASFAERYGSPAEIGAVVAANVRECRPFVGDVMAARDFDAVDGYVRWFLVEHAPLFRERARAGRIRDGHGDLRAEHVCLVDGVQIFDCVEFSEQLRTCDVASEIGFLAMDLDLLGMSVLADRFVETYADLTDDRELGTLMPFYKCHRALVRGKVEALKSREREVAEPDIAAARDAARRHFRLAVRYTRGRRRPELLIVCGLSGTGKSTVARAIGDLTGFPVLNSDVVRKDLAGIRRTARPSLEQSQQIYQPEFTRETYAELLRRAEVCLASGRGVVIDATFSNPEYRRWFVDLAARSKVDSLFLECRVEEREVARRLREREHNTDEVSDATLPVYLRQREKFAPFEIEARHLILDTQREREDVISEVEKILATPTS